MQRDHTRPGVELEAAQLVIQWKSLLGKELNRIAWDIATGEDTIRCSHYRQALPEAMARTMQLIQSQVNQADDEQYRAA